MKISDYAVKNYQFTLIIVIMIVVLGITTILGMPRSEDPEMHAPVYTITAIYPGASPKDMEDLVVDPLEKEIYQLENIKRLRTVIGDGFAVIRVDYKYSSDVEAKYQEVVRLVNSKQSELPPEIYSLVVEKWQPSDVNILQMALISENALRKKIKAICRRPAGGPGKNTGAEECKGPWFAGPPGACRVGPRQNGPDEYTNYRGDW